jgi:hypothetical protein
MAGCEKMHTKLLWIKYKRFNEQWLVEKECTQKFFGENTGVYNEQRLGLHRNAHRQRD